MTIKQIDLSQLSQLETPDDLKAWILIADEIQPPSTIGYHLGLCVFEYPDKSLVMTQRNLAFEGNLTGGGCSNSKDLSEFINSNNIECDAWVVDRELLDNLEGESRSDSSWNEILRSFEHLSTRASKDAEFYSINKNFKDFFSK
ncbi:hypothetical protein [Psychrobacter faecalis]|uniref:hypothetical protein n=1 Tax=Psychrobacter faecalis TaxID=180588 RepID=UPI003FD2B53F